MGSFAFTCAVSGLPIHAGDAVRFFLITETPYQESACNMHDMWFPRTFPLRAEYNDYGSVQNVEEGVQQDIWLHGLQADMVERGVGDNTVHDVATWREMDFYAMLRALQEGRAHVMRDFDRSGVTRPVNPGIPTMRSVEEALASLASEGLKFLVDEEEGVQGSVRVRLDGYATLDDELVSLDKAQKALTAYATMVTCTSGSSCDPAELLVRPLPNATTSARITRDSKAPLQVQQMMVREDVWQTLLKHPMDVDYGRRRVTIEDFVADVQKCWDASVARYAKHTSDIERWRRIGETHDNADYMFDIMLGSDISGLRENLVAPWLARDEIPYTQGLASHWRIMLRIVAAGYRTPEEVAAFLRTVAETIYATRVLMELRWYWRPSYSVGPQFGEWEKHAQFHRDMAELAEGHAEAERVERAKWDAEDEV